MAELSSDFGNVFLTPIEGGDDKADKDLSNLSATGEAHFIKPSDVVNNVTTTTTDKPLSANMGKELQDQITNLKNIGRFLAIWDCSTGKPLTEPTTSPYAYKTGDYYRVGTVAAEGSKNYKPDGSSYTTGSASTTEETEDVETGWVYYYDGTQWLAQSAGGGGKVLDVQVAGTTVLDTATGIANIPNANFSSAGVIKTGNNLSANTGSVYCAVSAYTQYNSANDYLFVGKGTLENVEQGASVADTTSTAATIASVAQNTHYTFSQPLTSLTVTAVASTFYRESTIEFSVSSSSFTISLPSTLKLMGDFTNFNAGYSYIMCIWKGYAIISEVND